MTKPLAVIRPALQNSLAKLTDIAVDIEPIFVSAAPTP
jgi:hypothetical protein